MLRFELLSKGEIVIDIEKCKNCATKSCVKNCRSSKSIPVLAIKGDTPHLDFTHDEIKKGACIECLACELDCRLYGNKAININLPIEQNVHID